MVQGVLDPVLLFVPSVTRVCCVLCGTVQAQLSYVRALRIAMKEPAVRWLLAASSVRYFGGYTIAAFGPLFFEVRQQPPTQLTHTHTVPLCLDLACARVR